MSRRGAGHALAANENLEGSDDSVEPALNPQLCEVVRDTMTFLKDMETQPIETDVESLELLPPIAVEQRVKLEQITASTLSKNEYDLLKQGQILRII